MTNHTAESSNWDVEATGDFVLRMLQWIGDEPFRLFAAAAILMSGMVFAFFRNENAWFKVFATLLLFGGTAAMGYAVIVDDPIDPIEPEEKDEHLTVAEILSRHGITRQQPETCVPVQFSVSAVFASLCVSSHVDMASQGQVEFGPRSMVDDGGQDTAWLARSPGAALGPYFYIDFGEVVEISSFSVANGFGNSEKDFTEHDRIRQLDFYDSAGGSAEIILDDANSKRWLDLNQPIHVSSIVFDISTVYRGQRFDFVGLSDFSLK